MPSRFIPRERGDDVWFISTKDELRSQRRSQYITAPVTTDPRQIKTTLSGALFSSEVKLEIVKHIGHGKSPAQATGT